MELTNRHMIHHNKNILNNFDFATIWYLLYLSKLLAFKKLIISSSISASLTWRQICKASNTKLKKTTAFAKSSLLLFDLAKSTLLLIFQQICYLLFGLHDKTLDGIKFEVLMKKGVEWAEYVKCTKTQEVSQTVSM